MKELEFTPPLTGGTAHNSPDGQGAVMSDDKQGADAQKTPTEQVEGQKTVDTSSGENKPWRNEAEVKKIIAERDKAEARLKEIAEREKKMAEEKAIEQGKTKEILAQRDAENAELRKKAELYEQEQKAIRERELDGFPDEFLPFTENMTTSQLIAFRKQIESQRVSPRGAKDAPPDKEGNPFERRPGESVSTYTARIDALLARPARSK